MDNERGYCRGDGLSASKTSYHEGSITRAIPSATEEYASVEHSYLYTE